VSEDSQDRAKSAELAVNEAKRELDSAISKYTVARANRNGFPGAYMVGYSMYIEYISPELVQNEATSGFAVVPADQAGSMSRGLFEFGAETYNRMNVRVIE